MGREYEPVVGKWFRDLDEDESFLVLSVHEDDELVEIQHVDGEVEEIELDTWNELDLEPAEQPEGWSASVDDDDDDEEWEEDDDDDDDDWDDDEDEDEDDDEDDDYRDRDDY